MSAHVSQELRAHGVAQVIVILKASPPRAVEMALGRPAGTVGAATVGAVIATLARCFAPAATSQAGAITSAAAEGRPWRPAVRAGRASPTACASAPAVRFYPNLGVLLGSVDRAGLAPLRADPRVSAVVPLHRVL